MRTADKNVSIGRIGLRSGLFTAVFLIIYFLFMRSLGLTGNAFAWGFNFIILYAGINFCYRYYRVRTDPNVEYLPGMLLGTEVTFVSVIVFSLFLYVYFSSVNPGLVNSLGSNVLFMSDVVTPMRAAAATFIEGLSSGVVISFAMMQYYQSGFRRPGKNAG